MMEILIMAVIGWVVCGIVNVGITVAFFDSEFPMLRSKEHHRMNLLLGIFFGLYGPIGTIMTYFLSGRCKHGWYLSYREPKP